MEASFHKAGKRDNVKQEGVDIEETLPYHHHNFHQMGEARTDFSFEDK